MSLAFDEIDPRELAESALSVLISVRPGRPPIPIWSILTTRRDSMKDRDFADCGETINGDLTESCATGETERTF